MSEKRRFLVTVKEYGDDHGRKYETIIGKYETWAVSPKKAISNVKYRVEGKAYRGEEYGTGNFWMSYRYEAEEA